MRCRTFRLLRQGWERWDLSHLIFQTRRSIIHDSPIRCSITSSLKLTHLVTRSRITLSEVIAILLEEAMWLSGLKSNSTVHGQLRSTARSRIRVAKRPLFEIGLSKIHSTDAGLRPSRASPIISIAAFVSSTARYETCTLDRSRMQSSRHCNNTP